ncbi:MAG: DUF2065 domain-containing protein [Pseudomonadales bacterium]|nr:DUF2065 domain-containing protein [Pseudomonadales bacterium]MCC6530271.1 DUF2065 domain-containing protein [Pseudomonadales bacterium]MCP5332114.1 DUF2065 domain-containing protein [Pseudomonadales bacterium]HMU90444.1 DUF2065 domain-containing protein [Pseudomonadales bacterium]HMW14204.1 DUF2065 domain-containing protein [Pseudomonadales bacterium]
MTGVGWHELLVALCLLLVLEGILPFVAPEQWRGLLQQIARLDRRAIRLLGLGSMLTGAGLLHLINH